MRFLQSLRYIFTNVTQVQGMISALFDLRHSVVRYHCDAPWIDHLSLGYQESIKWYSLFYSQPELLFNQLELSCSHVLWLSSSMILSAVPQAPAKTWAASHPWLQMAVVVCWLTRSLTHVADKGHPCWRSVQLHNKGYVMWIPVLHAAHWAVSQRYFFTSNPGFSVTSSEL